MGDPLVTVIMPVFEAAETLPWALASLRAQTYGAWECVIVDDGSGPETRRVIEQMLGGRVRGVRLERNQGRGRARAEALAEARGAYVCMLDADDWMMPERLERQVAALEADRSLALVSAGMYTVDRAGSLQGVRVVPGDRVVGPRVWESDRRLRPPQIAYAPSMVRADAARAVGFDAQFRRSEDLDFLLRLLPGRRYLELDELLYVYRIDGAGEPFEQRLLRSLASTAAVWRKQRWRAPGRAAWYEAQAHVKALAYRGLWALGARERVLGRWLRAPTQAERARHEEARARITRCLPPTAP